MKRCRKVPATPAKTADCPTNVLKPTPVIRPKFPNQNRMKIPQIDPEALLLKVRQSEDCLGELIRRMDSGYLDHKSAIYGLKEIWLQLKRLNDVYEPPE